MSDVPANHAPRGRRVQFTVRTFFVAAVLVSLFGAAASLRSIETRISALVALSWVTMAGVYWIPRWIGPLVALPVGTLLVPVVWGATLLVVSWREADEPWIIIPVAFAWGIALSLIVGFSRLIRVVRRLVARVWTRRRGESPFIAARPALWAVGYAMEVAAARIFISVGLAAAVWLNWIRHGEAAEFGLLLDVPIAPLVIGRMYPSPPREILLFLLVTGAVAFPLWAAAGWIIGWIVALRERRMRSVETRDADENTPYDDETPSRNGTLPFVESAP